MDSSRALAFFSFKFLIENFIQSSLCAFPGDFETYGEFDDRLIIFAFSKTQY